MNESKPNRTPGECTLHRRVEGWRLVWRDGIAPQLSDAQLEVLHAALERNDPRLVTGVVVAAELCVETGEPLDAVAPVGGACPIGYCGWQGLGLATIAEVVGYYGRVYDEVRKRLPGMMGAADFIIFVDSEPRETVVRELLGEVERTLTTRAACRGKGS